MFWTNVKLIFLRELRDQLRDRRTLFTILVLPLLLYPLMGMSVFQVQQFLKEHPSKVRIIGPAGLPEKPALLVGGKIAPQFLRFDSALLQLELIPRTSLSHEELQEQSQRDIQLGLCDAVVVFPADFGERLAALHSGDRASSEVPISETFYDRASDKSKVADQRIESIVNDWRDSLGRKNLEASHLSVATARPFELKQTDVAEE